MSAVDPCRDRDEAGEWVIIGRICCIEAQIDKFIRVR